MTGADLHKGVSDSIGVGGALLGGWSYSPEVEEGGSEARGSLTDGCLLFWPQEPASGAPQAVHYEQGKGTQKTLSFPVFPGHNQLFLGKDCAVSETPTGLNCSPLVSK